MVDTLKIGTRKSPLAMWQAEYVRDALKAAHEGLEVELVPIQTKGDKILDVALSKVGGKGLFVKELEVQLLEGGVDICVHSTKDMPAELPEGLGLLAFPPRADPRDAFVMGGHGGIAALPHGARVGTSSLRRQAQLLHARPDLEIVSVRGNIQTRMKKVKELGLACVVLAAAGLDRMASADNIGHRFEPDEMLPAAAQGILCIEGRIGDARVEALLKTLDDDDARWRVTAERAFLKALGGGCQVPIGAYAERSDEELVLRGLVATPDGRTMVQAVRRGTVHEAEALGRALGEEVLLSGGRRVLVEVGLGGETAGTGKLDGWTIAVTREDAPDDALSIAMLAQGAHVRALPLMKIGAPDDGAALERALNDLGTYDVLAFTSQVGVERFFSRLATSGVDLRSLKADALVGAVGPKTRAALASFACVADVVGDAGGEALIEAIAASRTLDGARVLFVRAQEGRNELAERARALGATVDIVAAYKQDVTDADKATIDAALKGARAVVATSPARVQRLVEVIGKKGALPIVVAIGETTAEAARAAGLSDVRTARSARASAIVEALVDEG